MNAEHIGIVAGIAAILVVLLVTVLVAVRIQKSRRRVREMSQADKLQILNEVAKPFGFYYENSQELFGSLLDAWQREQGYMAFYDRAAAGAGMVIDAWPVYFDFEGRTWLIEFWKGQYGINTGGEVGVYHADEIVPPPLYRTTRFDAAEDKEMPKIECCLQKNDEILYEIKAHHWWLTGFRMGHFSKPSELCMMATVTFERSEMAQAFFEGLQKSGQPRSKFRICCNEVYVRMDFSRKVAAIRRLQRKIVQCFNRLWCLLYRIVTHPFTDTKDRLLFLYYMMPFFFRRIFRCSKGCPKKGRRHTIK